jgi:hypothetical protein
MSNSLRIVVLGEMGKIPFPGMAWEILQYLEGFRRLGHHVWYVEDTNAWGYDPDQDTVTLDCTHAVKYIARLMNWAGMTDRWAYRAAEPDSRVFGMSESHFVDLFKNADVLINHAAATSLRPEHLQVPARVLLETDPGLEEIFAAKGDPGTLAMLRNHTHFSTWGENYGAADCLLPVTPYRYCATRMPVLLDWFSPKPSSSNGPRLDRLRFTTIGHWRQSGEETWNGETYYWSKHPQFLKFIDLPERIGRPLELALGSADEETIRMFSARGWRVVDAAPFGSEMYPFRDYISGSDGEFTVAKDVYVRLRTGWFSDRSSYYLATGRPVVTQDTGFGAVLPTGEGLFAFNTVEEIAAAFEAIDSDYARHRRAAREIAGEYFRAETVLQKLLDDLGI